jgi:tRNA threonylcarbamoyladenosine biosynthesis protein TsaB
VSILAVDTSARRRLVAVLAGPGGELLAARVEAAAPTVPALAEALAGLLRGGEVAAVAVVTGPGSYTGVRAGMAAALGLAHAGGLPLHGVGSLEVVALSAPAGCDDLVALADAGRGGVYAARFSRGGEGLVEVGEAQRLAVSALPGPPPPRVSLDPLDLPGLSAPGDAATALALAAAMALRRPRLDLAALAATHLG